MSYRLMVTVVRYGTRIADSGEPGWKRCVVHRQIPSPDSADMADLKLAPTGGKSRRVGERDRGLRSSQNPLHVESNDVGRKLAPVGLGDT